MATLKVATGALLTTVTATATTITDTIQSVSNGAKMLNDYTANAREMQQIAMKLNREGQIDEIRSNAAVRMAKASLIVDEYVAANPQQAARMDEILAKLDAVLA